MGAKKSRAAGDGGGQVPVAHPVQGAGGPSRKNEDIHGERLVGANIYHCDLYNCTLENCTVRKADIVGCQLFGGTFVSVDLKGGTVVERAQIRETDLYDCVLNNTTVHTFDVKGAVTLNGGRMDMGEVKPGGHIANNGGVVSRDVDNYNPHAGAPQAQAYGYPPQAAAYPPPVAQPVGGGYPPTAPPAQYAAAPTRDGGGASEDTAGAPNRFLCPITMEVMTDPVMSRTGHNFERTSILEWLASNGHCPQTRLPMSVDDLSPNRALKEEIEEWRHAQLTKKDTSN